MGIKCVETGGGRYELARKWAVYIVSLRYTLGMNHETGANSRMRTGAVVPVGDLDSP